MPELPEVETTLRGIIPWVTERRVQAVIVRKNQLRWLIPDAFSCELPGQMINRIERRAKYLIFHAESSAILMHLGMSGSLRLVKKDALPEKHDHVDIVMDDCMLRYRDPRRFGAILWVKGDPFQHALLLKLGPEPLSDGFDGAYLHQHSRRRTVAVKNFIMNSQIVVGVGNIYASEALFMAGIRPSCPAKKISKARYEKLAQAIQRGLKAAIKAGGTSRRDSVSGEGTPG